MEYPNKSKNNSVWVEHVKKVSQQHPNIPLPRLIQIAKLSYNNIHSYTNKPVSEEKRKWLAFFNYYLNKYPYRDMTYNVARYHLKKLYNFQFMSLDPVELSKIKFDKLILPQDTPTKKSDLTLSFY